MSAYSTGYIWAEETALLRWTIPMVSNRKQPQCYSYKKKRVTWRGWIGLQLYVRISNSTKPTTLPGLTSVQQSTTSLVWLVPSVLQLEVRSMCTVSACKATLFVEGGHTSNQPPASYGYVPVGRNVRSFVQVWLVPPLAFKVSKSSCVGSVFCLCGNAPVKAWQYGGGVLRLLLNLDKKHRDAREH